MARRTPGEQSELQPQTPAALPTAEGIPGGASGVPQDMRTVITDPGAPSGHAEISEDAPEVKVRRYQVMNDPPPNTTGFPVLLDGCLTKFPKGKIVLESAYDVEKLKSQGVILQEI